MPDFVHCPVDKVRLVKNKRNGCFDVYVVATDKMKEALDEFDEMSEEDKAELDPMFANPFYIMFLKMTPRQLDKVREGMMKIEPERVLMLNGQIYIRGKEDE